MFPADVDFDGRKHCRDFLDGRIMSWAAPFISETAAPMTRLWPFQHFCLASFQHDTENEKEVRETKKKRKERERERFACEKLSVSCLHLHTRLQRTRKTLKVYISLNVHWCTLFNGFVSKSIAGKYFIQKETDLNWGELTELIFSKRQFVCDALKVWGAVMSTCGLRKLKCHCNKKCSRKLTCDRTKQSIDQMHFEGRTQAKSVCTKGWCQCPYFETSVS